MSVPTAIEFVNDRGNIEGVRMEGVDQGVVAIITNHSYLDNPTFKGMRKSLMEIFNQIFILDLHGSAKKQHSSPHGADENVFDIEQGVAISIFVKQPDAEKSIWHADMWGRRIEKYKAATEATKASIQWAALRPIEPLWLFKPYNADADAVYRRLWSLKDIFAPMGDPAPGIVTTHDAFAISFTPEEAREKVAALIATRSEEEARLKFRLCRQEQWSYQRAKIELPLIDLHSATRPVSYRPFDNRWTIWNRNVAVHRRERVTLDMQKDNLAIDVCRVVSEDWKHVLAVDLPPDDSFISNRTKERGFVFPIRIGGSENLSVAFRDFIDQLYDYHHLPEEIFSYIYAVLYAPAYRKRYAEFLRIDFPRIPFPEENESFEAISKLGWALVQAHLLRELPRRGLAAYNGKGDHTVEAVRYSPEQKAVWINKTQFFKPVPQAVWDFHIGGYQVLDKYLKSRKGRTLSLDEINHVGAVADSLAFTIDQMTLIDKAYRSAVPDGG
jgi:predicted helicase